MPRNPERIIRITCPDGRVFHFKSIRKLLTSDLHSFRITEPLFSKYRRIAWESRVSDIAYRKIKKHNFEFFEVQY